MQEVGRRLSLQGKRNNPFKMRPAYKKAGILYLTRDFDVDGTKNVLIQKNLALLPPAASFDQSSSEKLLSVTFIIKPAESANLQLLIPPFFLHHY